MGDPASYERFRREVKIGNILTHPNIQKLYELAETDSAPYLVLEYIPGNTLRDELQRAWREKPKPGRAEEMAVALGRQIGNALAYTHAHGVFHRDLKPENVIVTPDGTAKVMDFGIAFMEGSRRITWGALSSQAGTPDYMAPEQIRGQRGDDRTDLYALGMILYECVTGRLPYEGDNALAVMNQHVTVSPPPPHQFQDRVSPALEEVILKAIRRKPEARWPSAKVFVEAIDSLDTLDVATLKAERERDETDSGTLPQAQVGEFAMPPWKVGVIVCATLIALVALTLLVQLLHHPH
jgi:serine/threonine-protein kinase